MDFLNVLPKDLALDIFQRLDGESLMRAKLVSKSWLECVTGNALVKKLFKRLVNQTCPILFMPENASYEVLLRVMLLRAMEQIDETNCIVLALLATSRDPKHEFFNTYNDKDTYWSSPGQIDAKGKHTLVYKLDELSIVSTLRLRGPPEFRAVSGRILFGTLDENGLKTTVVGDSFEVPFDGRVEYRLSKPMLCFNNFVSIELYDNAEIDPSDNLYRTKVCNVSFMGIPLQPFFSTIATPSDQVGVKVENYVISPRIVMEVENVDGGSDEQ